MNLQSLRGDIDRIDQRILELLEARLEKALLIRRHKTETLDGGRERQVLDAVLARAKGLHSPAFLEGLYGSILERSKAVQDEGRSLIGFQGSHGAYGEMAAQAWRPEAACLPFADFGQVFDAVLSGSIDYGIVPVENTLGGVVDQVSSILAYTELRVIGAVDMPIHHCLLVPPGTDHQSVRVVYSHPQALAQCRLFLTRNRLEGREFFDTAGAARMLGMEGPPASAAIASQAAAERYGLDILKAGIEDAPSNRTRFFILARLEATENQGTKCSVVFHSTDKAGALFGILRIFAEAGINLSRIESVPDKPGDYAIFIDLDGSTEDPVVSAALESAATQASRFRLLGCYHEMRLEP